MNHTLENKLQDFINCKQEDNAKQWAMLWASEQPTSHLHTMSTLGDTHNRVHAMIRVACKRELRSRV